MASKIQVQYGPFVFNSGFVPHTIQGPSKDMYVVEHQIPGSEGGVVEYVGSKHATYQLKGFLTSSNDLPGGPAGAVLSGTSYLAVTTDTAKDYLMNLRVSGAQLLRIESTITQTSGYPVLYENGFFFIKKLMFAYEAGRGYAYYPYTIDLVRTSGTTYGNSSGVATYEAGFSGYITAWEQTSGVGLPNGEMIIALGIQVKTVASGNMKMALYSSGGVTLLTQSAAQPTHSGWNYFPLQPSYLTVSGTEYMFAIKGDSYVLSGQAFSSGFNILQAGGIPATSGRASLVSGIVFSAAFPAGLTFGTLFAISGNNFDTVMVV